MKTPVTHLLVLVCPILAIASSLPRSASAQDIVEQRIVLNWGVWNWDNYSIHGVLQAGSGVPDGQYQLHLIQRNGTSAFDSPFQIINGQPSPPEWVWSDFTYQARFVPDDGWRMAAISATGISGPAQGLTFPASGENTVWRLDRYFPDGNVPLSVHKDFNLHVLVGGYAPTPTPPSINKCNDDKSGGNQENCQGCTSAGMARYSVHSMLVSLNMEDTPLRYTPPRGPAIDFTVTYNQKENQQPAVFSYSNLGPKWTFGWLSYVIDNPAAQAPAIAVYLPGGGTETYPFDSVSQTFSPDPQSHALLVRTGPGSYEKRFPDGSKQIFNLSNGASTYPRRLFLTQTIDPAGNVVSIGYDSQRRVTTITDALGQITTVAYQLATDPLKITKVTDPFGRFATFQYEDGKLKTITDEIGIQSQFSYLPGTDSIDSLTTPYGTTTLVSGESGTNRWIEITDPLGGKERVEYRDGAPGISATDPVSPNVPGMINAGLDSANTFYWDKKAMSVAPGDYSKARIKHWLYNLDGSISGIIASEKQPLENRVWYRYFGQSDYRYVGSSGKPSQVARVLADGSTQLYQYEYNGFGKKTKFIDPAGRVVSYIYDSNQIDLLETRQSIGANTELLRQQTYNGLHEPLTDTDAAGQVTAFTYNAQGQILSRTNARSEVTLYAYGGTVPPGYLASITSPSFNGVSVITNYSYDSFGRVRTITDTADKYTVTTEYDNLDRKIRVTHPDATYEQFKYTDNVTGVMTLDLTGSRDRVGRWTYRHYNANRQMDSITDPGDRTTLFGWCACGSLISITDPNGNVTTFNRDLQNRIYQKVYADETTVDYLFEGQTTPNTPGATSRLQSSTDALHLRTNYSYSIDNNINGITYTDSLGNPLDPATPSVSYTYDPNYNRITTMTDGTGVTSYAYYPVDPSPTPGAGRLKSIDGPLANDTVTVTYDELGRIIAQSLGGTLETLTYDSLGRLRTTENALGHFDRQYEGLTARLRTLSYPNGQSISYAYYGNESDRRLQTLQSVSEGGVNLSKFEYTYDSDGQITSWSKVLDATSSGCWFEYNNAHELAGARNAANPSLASQRCDYAYDRAGNPISDSSYDPHPIGGGFNGTFTTYSTNALNQLDSRTVQLNDLAPVRSELSYDLAGNLKDDGEGRRFAWDAANRLITIYHPDKTQSEFTYDGLSRRVQIVEKTGSTVVSTTRFVWIGSKMAQERDETDTILRKYFAEGEQRRTALGKRENYYYTRDHLGSIRELTSGASVVLARYDYDPYGSRTKLGGALEVDLGYTGHYHHARSGLDLSMYRAYNPALRRWISRDPIEERGGLNLYEYVENDPVNAIDPSGLFKVYGNWCGPDWTGGRSEGYTPHSGGYYQAPVNPLDSACEKHDVCYYQCRDGNPCDGDTRSQCFRECDRTLTQAANSVGGFWGRIIARAIDRPGKRLPEHDDPSCCQKGK